MSAPDLIEEVVGWRAWTIKLSEPKRPVLYSPVRDGSWPPDAWFVAECGRGHQPPGEHCSCGVYAARDREHLDDLRYAYDDRLAVIGEVGLAGRVVVGTMGWRAERARVRRLFVPYEHWPFVAPLAATYRVPVDLANTLGPQELVA